MTSLVLVEVERSNEEKFAMLSAPQAPANLEAVTSFENHHTKTDAQSQNTNSSNVQEVSHSDSGQEPGVNGSANKEEGEEGDPVKKVETHDVVVGEMRTLY